jgi:hypothetical protein
MEDGIWPRACRGAQKPPWWIAALEATNDPSRKAPLAQRKASVSLGVLTNNSLNVIQYVREEWLTVRRCKLP